MEEQHPHEAHVTPGNTELAFERTVLSHERTLMAWVRTAVSMISFGFTIYKIFEEISHNAHVQQRLLSPRTFGMIMISFGFLGLLLAQIQHYVAMKRLKKDYPHIPLSVSSVLATLMLLFGLALFLAALFRQ